MRVIFILNMNGNSLSVYLQMLMSVPVVPVRMEDRAVIKLMDITVAVNQDFMEATARSVKGPRFCECLFMGIY